MHGAQSGAGQHSDDGFRDHRHVDDHAIALVDTVGGKSARKTGDFIKQFRVADLALGIRYRAVVDDRCLITASALDMAINSVVTGVQPTA